MSDNVRQDNKTKHGLSDPKTAYIQSPRRNTVRGLGGLLDKVKPELLRPAGKWERGDDME